MLSKVRKTTNNPLILKLFGKSLKVLKKISEKEFWKKFF